MLAHIIYASTLIYVEEMMKVQAQLKWQDYLSAQRLHSNPFKGSRLTNIGFGVALGIGVLLTLLFSNNRTQEIIVFMIVVGGGFYTFSRYILMPNRIKRIFKQQKELQAPLEMEITKSAFTTTNEFGTSAHPWDMFLRWRENKDIFMLYYSDALYSLIPKRMLTEEQTDLIRNYLIENIKGTSQRNH